MPARQLTTKELIDILDGRIDKAGKGPGRDALIEQWKTLNARASKEASEEQKRHNQTQAKLREEREANRQGKEDLRRKQQELDALYQSGATGDGAGEGRPRTAEDARKELANRGKNPPRGNLKPGDNKKPPKGGGGNAKPVGAGKGTFRPSVGIAILPTASGGTAQELVDKFFPDPDDKRDPMYKLNQSKDPLTVAARFSRSIQRAIASTAVNATPLGLLINSVDKEVKHFRGINPKDENVLNKDVSGGQIATLVQGLSSAIANLEAISAGMSEKQNAIISQNQSIMQALQIVGAATALNPSIMASVSLTESKIRQVNFAAIKNSADNAAKIAGENKVKLGAANFTLQNQAAQLAKTKLEILDATQLMATSRLAEKKWNILDATQIMETSRLAEKKWNILDATQLMNTSRLAEKKWNILDATQLMSASRTAEAKWGILDVTQLMRYSRAAEIQLPATKAQLTKIEAKVGQPVPVNLTPVLNAINAIPSKFPAPLNLSGLTSQITSLSNQITGVNNSIASIPSKINTKAPDLTPVLNAINNIRIPAPQPTNLTPVLNAIDLIPSKIPAPKPTDLSPVLSAIGKIPTTQPTDLTPVLGAIAGIPGKIPTPNLTPINSKLDNISGVVQKIDKDNEEQKSPTTIAVKVWDSARKAIGIKTLSVPKQQAEAIKLLADEAAEAQEDSNKDRAEKKSALQKIGDRLKLNQVLSALNTILTVHNAAMLATNLTQTLGDLISNGLAAFGIKDDVGNDLDINSIVGKQVEALLKQILGEDVYNGTKLSWQKASRVVSTAANVAWTIQSIADSTRSIMEMTAENTGRIGNALKKYRVVGENAYAWMPEDVTARTAAQAKIDKLIEGLSGVENAASSIGSVVGDVRSIQSEVGELKTQRAEFKTAIEQAVAPTAPPENQPVKTAAASAKTASTGTGDIAKTTRDQAED
jgi:hypothetical protein